MATHTDWLLDRFRQHSDQPAIVWRDRTFTFGDLVARVARWLTDLAAAGVSAGDSVALVGDYSPASIACLLALAEVKCVLVPLALESRDQHRQFFEIAEIDHLIELDADDHPHCTRAGERRAHPLIEQLRADGAPGLVLFSSGSTGEPKAILHALPPLLVKFRTPRHRYRTVSFLLFDHIGGFNTLLYTLANLGTVIVPGERTVAGVCRAVQQHKVELLPTTPSFLNLLLLAEAHVSYDLSSLVLITYGTEVMPERTLRLANAAFPGRRFQQTYGLSELGILRSKSASNDSLFVKVGGEDVETRVVDGTLHVRATTSMLGYLNAPNPFGAEGWFDTGDDVIQEGDYYRILGRHSEIINVGGRKVYPSEVERVIAELPGVIDVSVAAAPHLLVGQIVVATVQMERPADAVLMRRRIAEHCRGRLQPFMVPAKVKVVTDSQVNYRFKKGRSSEGV